MTSLTKTKIIGTGLLCLFGGLPSYDKELTYHAVGAITSESALALSITYTLISPSSSYS